MSMHHEVYVLYQRCQTLNDDESIPRTGKKALDVTEYTEQHLHRYAKTQQMPEPPLMPDASLLDKAAKEKERGGGQRLDMGAGKVCK